MSQFPAALNAREDDIQKMLACQVHIGSRNLEPSMERYIWKRRSDGIHLIDLQKTWEKLVLAARVIATIENPADICVVSSREFGQRAVLKFAKYTGAQALAGRWTPGTLTNQIQDKFMEPRILILTDPRTDSQPIREASYVNIPTIAFAHTDSSLRFIDIAIPCNNKGKHAIGLMWWMLTREVLLLKNTQGLIRGQPWDVMVDLFLYRAPEEQEKDETAAMEGAPGFQGAEGQDWTAQAQGEQWEGQDWGGKAQGEWGAPAAAEGSWDPTVTGTSNWEAQQE